MPNNLYNTGDFSFGTLTAATNIIPEKPHQLGEIFNFTAQGVATNTVAIDEQYGAISVIPTSKRGTVGKGVASRNRKVRYLEIPHYAHYDSVKAVEVQGVRKWGSTDEMETVIYARDQKLENMKANHEVTWEFARAGAITGRLYDFIDYDTQPELIYDWHEEFSVARNTHKFNWSGASVDVRQELVKAKRKAEKELVGMKPTRWIWLCPDVIHDEVVVAPSIKSAFERWEDGSQYRADNRAGFTIADNIDIVSYESRSIGNLKFLADDESYLVPVMDDFFQVRFGPADTAEAVNTIGLPLYTMAEPMPFDRGTEMVMESNHLHFTTRPRGIVQIKAS